jgi:transcriptional regulator with PAS, ATPase and Fis domain
VKKVDTSKKLYQSAIVFGEKSGAKTGAKSGAKTGATQNGGQRKSP